MCGGSGAIVVVNVLSVVLWLRLDAEDSEAGGLGAFSGYRVFCSGLACAVE